MSSRALVFIFIAFVVDVRVCYSKKYDNYSLLSVHPKFLTQVEFLQDLQTTKNLDLIFMNSPNTRDVLVLIHNKDKKVFLRGTDFYGLKTRNVSENVQTMFDAQIKKETAGKENNWEYIRTLDDIYEWLNLSTAKFPKLVTLESIGKSEENRDIFVFSTKAGKALPSVIIEAGIHGHEWISTAIATYLIDQLLTRDYRPLIKAYQFHIIPILNPDGYVYSQTSDRLWRKNRRAEGSSIGVDLNRNFDYIFGMFDAPNSTDNEHYPGPKPFSERETRAIRNFVRSKNKTLQYYFALHGFGQSFILPVVDDDKKTRDYNDMFNLAKIATQKINDFSGRTYKVGTAYEQLGKKISGDSVSWVKNEFQVPYTYTILSRDDSKYGHALPNEHIRPACQEFILAIKSIINVPEKKFRGIYDSLDHAPDQIVVAPLPLIFIVVAVVLVLSN